MQDKTWYSILGLDAEPLFLQDHMLSEDPGYVDGKKVTRNGKKMAIFET